MLLKTSHRTARRFVLLLLFLRFPMTFVAQHVIHVPADQPTIQAGVDSAQNGDTVLVSPGVYQENVDLKGKAITLTSGATSYAAATATVIQGVASTATVYLHTGETLSTVVNGFTITHSLDGNGTRVQGNGVELNTSSGTFSNNLIQANAGCGVGAYSAPQLVLQGNRITGQTSPSVYTCITADAGEQSPAVFSYQSGSLVLNANLIDYNDTRVQTPAGQADGFGGVLLVASNSVTATGNIIHDNIGGTSGLSIERTSKAVIVQNLLYHNYFPNTGYQYSTTGLGASGPDDPIKGGNAGPVSVVMLNNTLYDSPNTGYIYATHSAFGVTGTLVNSLIANNLAISGIPGDQVLNCRLQPGSVISVLNNDFYAPATPQTTSCTMNGSSTGNLSVDPQFLSTATFDLHTADNSPVVAAGDVQVQPLPVADLDGHARTVCGTIDMGVYEVLPHPPLQLTTSNNPSFGGTNVTFGAQLTGNCNVPTGSVTFLDGATALGTTLLNSSAYTSLSTSALTVGNHTISATYPGDFNFSTASGSLTQIVNGDPSATTLSVSPNPAAAFGSITLSANVSSAYGQPTGSVTFTANGVVIATAALQAGVASAVVSTFGAGSYNIVATYSADIHFAASSSAATVLVVNGANSTTSLSSSVNPAALTQGVTFTAQVAAAQGSNLPTGVVTFSDGSALLGSGNLNSSGIATFSTSSLSFGPHAITARYTGSANFNPSSASLTETIAMIATTTSLATSPNPSNTGQSVSLAATATSGLVGTVPSGTVQFYDGTSLIGSATLDGSGLAHLTYSSLTIGAHSLHATLLTGTTFAGSDSPVVNQVVLAYDFTLNLSKPSVSLPSGDWTVIQVTVASIGGYRGTVQLNCDTLPAHAQCNWSNGGAAFLASGTQTLQLTLNTSDVYKFGSQAQVRMGSDSRGLVILCAVLCLPLTWFGRRRRVLRLASLSLLAMLLGAFVQGCSGKLPDRTPAGTYSVNVKGQDSSPGSLLQHSALLTMQVTN